MHISINTDEPLSDVDKQILSVLAGGAVAPSAPAAKAAPAKAAPKASKAKDEPTPDPEPEADEPAEDTDGPTLDDAKDLATKMVSNGDAAKVKKALGTVGAKKVSEVPEDKVADFIAALS